MNSDEKKTEKIPKNIKESDFEELLTMETTKYSKDEVIGGITFQREKISATRWRGHASVLLETKPIIPFYLFWDLEFRRKWDPFWSEMKMMSIFPPSDDFHETELIYQSTIAPPFISKRDFLQFRSKKVSDDLCIGVYLPADNSFLPIKKGYVRGIVLFSGLIVRSINNTNLDSYSTPTSNTTHNNPHDCDSTLNIPNQMIHTVQSTSIIPHLNTIKPPPKLRRNRSLPLLSRFRSRKCPTPEHISRFTLISYSDLSIPVPDRLINWSLSIFVKIFVSKLKDAIRKYSKDIEEKYNL